MPVPDRFGNPLYVVIIQRCAHYFAFPGLGVNPKIMRSPDSRVVVPGFDNGTTEVSVGVGETQKIPRY